MTRRSTLSLPAAAVLLAIAAAVAVGVARFGPAPAVDAGTALRLDVAGLVAGSARVLEGRVLALEAHEASGGRVVTTEALLEVERVFHGADVGLASVRWPGGLLADGRGMVVPGMPRLAVGERVLLFLSEPSGPERWDMPVGLAQGKWRVHARADGTKALERAGAPLALVETGARNAAHATHLVRDYAEVVAEVHAALAASGRAR